MIIDKAKVSTYTKDEVRGYTFTVNAFWVTIRDSEGQVIFDRSADKDNWLDKPHAKITKALSTLETALIDAVKESRLT